MSVAGEVFRVVFSVFILAAPAIWIYWATTGVMGDQEVGYKRVNPTLYVIVGYSTFLSLTVTVGMGLDDLLFFIPQSWGRTDEDGFFVSVRNTVAFLIGGGYALGVLCLLHAWAIRRRRR